MTPLKRGNIYYAVWSCMPGACATHTEPTQHWTSLGTRDKREARLACAALEEKQAYARRQTKLGLPLEIPVEDLMLKDFKKLYLDSTVRDKAASTHATEAHHLTSLVNYLGPESRLSSMTQARLEDYKKYRLRVIAPRSWNSELATLKSIFGWGMTRVPALYKQNPVTLTKVDPGEPTVAKYIQTEDLIKVVRSCTDEYWKNVITFMYATWCRGSELRGLKWSDVDLISGVIEFRRPKERKRKRMPITPVIKQILGVARKYSQGSEFVFPNPEEVNGVKGVQLTKDALHHKLQWIGDKAGVKLSPHMLRHSGITDALRNGAELFAVQRQAGHSQITTTAGYVHTDMLSQSEAMGKLKLDILQVSEDGVGEAWK